MTREEAKEELEFLASCSYVDEFEPTEIEALKMAIKALKQEPCEEAISRAYIEPIIEELENICVNGDEHILNLLADIKNAPLVTPQLKTGHWIRGHHGFGCSNCHKSIEGQWDDNIDDITGTLFCPNCGARMESEGEVIMNSCLCESCCDKDYCLSYQDYKNPDGIVAEPITACGRYKKLHTVEDTYTKEEVNQKVGEKMPEIELVIKIDEKIYNAIVKSYDCNCFSTEVKKCAFKAIYNGTILPKGHGTLKDVDNIKTAFPSGEYVRTESIKATIDHEETIIEADKESEVK